MSVDYESRASSVDMQPPGRYDEVNGKPSYEIFVGPQKQDRLVLRGLPARAASYLLDPQRGGKISKAGLAFVLDTDLQRVGASVNNVTEVARLAGIGIREDHERGEYVIEPSGKEPNGSISHNATGRAEMPHSSGRNTWRRYSPDPLDYPGRRNPNRTTGIVFGPRDAPRRSSIRRYHK